MTREDIIRMAREAGIHVFPEFEAAFERFATMVAAAEREACANVCDDIAFDWHKHAAGGPVAAYNACAAAIRARGNDA